MNTTKIGQELVEEIEGRTNGMADEDYLEVLEEIVCTLDACISAKRSEMEDE